jgi:hypothetical protein
VPSLVLELQHDLANDDVAATSFNKTATGGYRHARRIKKRGWWILFLGLFCMDTYSNGASAMRVIPTSCGVGAGAGGEI